MTGQAEGTIPSSVFPLLTDSPDRLSALVFDLEVHWTSPCTNCGHEGRANTHAARRAALEQLIVGGWLDPRRRWPFPVPAFMAHLIGEAVPDGAQ